MDRNRTVVIGIISGLLLALALSGACQTMFQFSFGVAVGTPQRLVP